MITKDGPVACVDCAQIVEQSPGRGRPRIRCDVCWERFAQVGGRGVLRRCLECDQPAEFRRSYCAAHPIGSQYGKQRICPCGKLPEDGRSWYCSPDCRKTARQAANRRRQAKPSRLLYDRTRGQAKNAEDKPHRKPQWKRVRLVVLADHPPCGICLEPIDYSLRFPDPMSASVDHIVSWRRGGAWFDLSNLRAAHFGCNAGRREEVA